MARSTDSRGSGLARRVDSRTIRHVTNTKPHSPTTRIYVPMYVHTYVRTCTNSSTNTCASGLARSTDSPRHGEARRTHICNWPGKCTDSRPIRHITNSKAHTYVRRLCDATTLLGVWHATKAHDSQAGLCTADSRRGHTAQNGALMIPRRQRGAMPPPLTARSTPCGWAPLMWTAARPGVPPSCRAPLHNLCKVTYAEQAASKSIMA